MRTSAEVARPETDDLRAILRPPGSVADDLRRLAQLIEDIVDGEDA